jgi:L-alanine-DL-glutamate epimerase-like enolase superfamily enzyme
MGDPQFMQDQIEEKIEAGFSTIKMKIGAIDFDSEIKLLEGIRSNYSPEEITLRVDANGAFTPEDALSKLERLSELAIHSIEQPIKAGQWNEMAALCSSTPLPIALDEELIGINKSSEKVNLIQTIQPQYIILKPSLHGGLSGTREWIEIAESNNIPWWITSALESNIGLKAICQFTAEFDNNLPQGLGTGSLYVDNSTSRLKVEQGTIFIS